MFLAAMATIFASGAIAPLLANGQAAAGTCGVARTVVSREAISTDTSYPGARPFNGPRVLVFEVRPAVSGTARLTLSSGSVGNASLGHMDTFDGAVSNGIARFSLNLPYDRQYEFMKLAAGDSRPVSVVRAEGEFVQTEAEAMRLDVETGNPLHLVRDDTERPVLAVRNPTEKDIAWQAVFELTDVFGRRLDIPFSRTVAAKTDARVEIPWPLPAKGLWRVTAKVKGADGSTARKETRFAFVDRHERTPIAEKPKFRFGIHYHGTRYWPHLLDNTISALVASGAKLTRCDYDHMWGDIERAKGKFDWKKSDAMIERLRNAGLALDIIMFSEPPWAMDEGAKAKVADQKKRGHRVRYIPLKPGTLRTFAETYARRYGTKIDYYEVGNEMDLTSCESFPHEAALAIQREAYEGIHAGCSNACVTTCGWAYAFTEPNATPDRWNVGLPEAFAEHPETYDAWALHVHGSFAKYADIIDGGYAALRQRTPLKTRPWIANETALTCVKGQEETVARNVWMKPLFAWSRGARDYVWYNLRATGWFDGHEPGYGLITPDFYPRAGYAAFAALTAVFQGLDYDGAVYSHRLRHLLCFKGVSQAFPSGGLVLAGWDDGLGVKGMRTVRIATDAKSAEICDHMGNRKPVAVKGGEIALALTREPQALLLPGATRAVAADIKELTRSLEGVKTVNIAHATRPADFTVDDSAHFKSLYEANPPFVHRLWKGPKDLSAKLWLGRTDEGLLRVTGDVTDDIAAAGDALEVTVVTRGQGRRTFTFKPSGRTGTVTRYEVALPVKENAFAFDFRVLEDDGEGADGWLMLCREGEDPVEVRLTIK